MQVIDEEGSGGSNNFFCITTLGTLVKISGGGEGRGGRYYSRIFLHSLW